MLRPCRHETPRLRIITSIANTLSTHCWQTSQNHCASLRNPCKPLQRWELTSVFRLSKMGLLAHSLRQAGRPRDQGASHAIMTCNLNRSGVSSVLRKAQTSGGRMVSQSRLFLHVAVTRIRNPKHTTMEIQPTFSLSDTSNPALDHSCSHSFVHPFIQ